MIRMIIVRRGETSDAGRKENEKEDSEKLMPIGSNLLVIFPS